MNAALAALFAGGAVLAWPARAMPALPANEHGARPPRRRWSDPESEGLAILDATVTLLRTGTPPGHAVALAAEPFASAATWTAPHWQQLRCVAADEGDVAAMWDALGERWSLPSFRDIASAWRMSQRHGCPLADAVAAAAAGVRARRAHRRSVDAAVAGARASIGVLLLLPVLGALLGIALGVDVLECYSGASGLVTLWPGLGLLWAGHRWAGRLVAGALRPPREAS